MMRTQGVISGSKKRLDIESEIVDNNTCMALGSQTLCRATEEVTRINYSDLTRTKLAVVIVCPCLRLRPQALAY